MSAGYLRKCAGKVRHDDKVSAEEHRKGMVRDGRWTMSASNTYRCNQCGGWHTGNIGIRFKRKGRGRR